VPLASRIRNVTLHHLNGQVHLDLTLSLDTAQSGSAHAPAILALVKTDRRLEMVGRLRVVFE